MSKPEKILAPWALPLGLSLFAAYAAASIAGVVLAKNCDYLFGLLLGIGMGAAALVAGLRWVPAWSRRTSAVLMFASLGWFTLLGFALLRGVFFFPGLHDYMLGPSGGAVAGCFVLSLLLLVGGWVYRDAQQRGLNAAGWAAIAILFFPYLLGLIAYLILVVLRDQRQAVCTTCGARLAAHLAFCTQCGVRLSPVCSHCGAQIPPGSAFCGVCGQPARPTAL